MDTRERTLRVHRCRQHGVFSLGQALAAGFTRQCVRRRLADCMWEEVDTRVYLVATGVAPSPKQLLIARTLATGGVASGASAAALHGLVPFPAEPQVTVVRSRRSIRHNGVHSTRELPAADVMVVDGIPVTTPVRTILDLVATLPLREGEALVDHAIVTRVVRVPRLEARARELSTPRRRGCAIVLRLLESRHPQLERARNGFEARVLRLLDRAGAPSPRVNYRVRTGGRVRYLDLGWPEFMVAVELDGFVPHSTRAVFDDDRARQNSLVADGWTVFRLTWTALERDPHAALAPVLAVLAR